MDKNTTAPNFNHLHYVPILKTKAGERWALSHLSLDLAKHATPLMEFHTHKTTPISIHVAETCEALGAAWGVERPIFLDTHWLHGESGNPAVIQASFDSAREQVKAIPVVRMSYEESCRDELASVIEQDGRGLLLRIRVSDLNHPDRIDTILSDLSTTARDGHLMIDYRGQQMNLESDIPRVPHLEEWRTITVASGVFPRSLADYSLNEWHSFSRLDWTSWKSGIESNLKRKPAFADYATRDPGAPAGGGLPRVSLRYARKTKWLVRQDGRVADGASPQMKQVCASLVATKEFDGPSYSAGDSAIALAALPESGPGNAGQWVMWGINHHLVLTLREIGGLS
jgi:hypothetical protein